MSQLISPAQWQQYEDQGYLRLGKVLTQEKLDGLCQRIDDIMLGKAQLDYDKLLMQLDSADGAYENAGKQSRGWKGETLKYRKIQELEHDELFMNFVQDDLFREVCSYVYGPETPIASFRAMFMNKPAQAGTLLPWHQDRWASLDKDPLITVWTALDPATIANGCVEIIPASHKWGLINAEHGSGFLTPEQAEDAMKRNPSEFLELEAGEAVLLHNWLLHRSDVNRSDISRRAFSVCYMDATTVDKWGETFTTVFEGQTAAAA